MLTGAVVVFVVALLTASYAFRVFEVKWALVLLALKIAAGFIAPVYYFYFLQSGDLIYYHQYAAEAVASINEGTSLQNFLLAEADPAAVNTPQTRSFFFIKILSLIYWTIGTHFWIASMLFSLLAFLATTYFIKRLGILNSDIKGASMFVFFFWPGIAIWGTGLGKESLMLSAMLFFAGSLLPVLKGIRSGWLLHLFYTVMAFLVLLYLRPFVLMVFTPCLVLWWMLPQWKTPIESSSWWRLGVGVLTLASLLILLWFGPDPGFRPAYILTAFHDAHAAVVAHSRPEHVVEGLEELRNGAAILWQIVLATIAGILGPFVWEINSPWELLLLTEPILLLTLFFTNWGNKKAAMKEWLPVAIFVLCLSCFVTLATPNYGSLSRYRVAWYPALLLLAVYGHPWLTKISDVVFFKKA